MNNRFVTLGVPDRFRLPLSRLLPLFLLLLLLLPRRFIRPGPRLGVDLSRRIRSRPFLLVTVSHRWLGISRSEDCTRSSLEDSILIGPTGGPEETAGGGGPEGVVSPKVVLLGIVSPGVVSLRVVSPGVILLGVVSPGVAEDIFFPPLSFFLISALKSGSSFISLAALITFCSARLNIEKCRLLPVIKVG